MAVVNKKKKKVISRNIIKEDDEMHTSLLMLFNIKYNKINSIC